MSFFFGGFDKQRYSAHLRMVVERLRIAQNKRQNEIKIERRELSVMLATRKFDKARIKVESVLRKTREGEASEVLALMVDLLIERVPLVASEKTCPADLIESVATVLWAAPRAGVEELKVVRDQLVHKYTDKWAAAVTAGPEMRVNGKVFTRLTNDPPSDAVKVAALVEIAKDYGVALDVAALSESLVGLPALDAAIVAQARADLAGVGASASTSSGASLPVDLPPLAASTAAPLPPQYSSAPASSAPDGYLFGSAATAAATAHAHALAAAASVGTGAGAGSAAGVALPSGVTIRTLADGSTQITMAAGGGSSGGSSSGSSSVGGGVLGGLAVAPLHAPATVATLVPSSAPTATVAPPVVTASAPRGDDEDPPSSVPSKGNPPPSMAAPAVAAPVVTSETVAATSGEALPSLEELRARFAALRGGQ